MSESLSDSASSESRGATGDTGGTASGGTGGQSGGGSHSGGSGQASGADDESSTSDGEFRFDVSSVDTSYVCAPPSFASCDGVEDAGALSWQHVMGLCGSDAEFESMAADGAIAFVHGKLGAGHSPYAVREGESMVLLSTGRASELLLSPAELQAEHPLECGDPLQCPSSNLGVARRSSLPPPLTARGVHDEVDCSVDPTLVGEGDCSNSLEDPWARGNGAYDYGELRMRATVPRFTDAFQFDFAFFSSEYPLFTDEELPSLYNDMFIAWLESEAWTGNVSFDDGMQPITAQSVFMDYRSPSDSCPDCTAPELEGFAMEHHAGTKWLSTKAPVVPGESIELVFSIFDLSDAGFDSAVLLDNFEWTCSTGRPVTSEG